jgi:hypothetical protein
MTAPRLTLTIAATFLLLTAFLTLTTGGPR